MAVGRPLTLIPALTNEAVASEHGSMRQRPVIICLALVLITLGLYAPVLHHSFVNFDDQAYVTENPHVQAGLTASGVAWAFSSAGYASNWHPLTWISHMLDCQLFGLNPAGHHVVNVVFHAANSVLLFLLLLRMTGALWRSALVAALFAWHPLHVESVAWVSERKDVLSAFFCLLALLAYAAYAKKFKVEGSKFKVLYGLALALFACGLMSKPMLVTVPLVMLLMDVWPLRRISDPRFAVGGLPGEADSVIEKVSLKRALLEKAPFLALALISSILTIVAQHAGGSVASLSRLPVLTRVSMALVSYCRYLAKTIWPENLSAYYPPVAGWPSWMVLTSAVFLTAACVYTWRARHARPYLAVGWLWFLVMLVPVIGLVQVGTQAMADRYTYLPAIGIFMMIAWELERLSRSAPQVKVALSGVCCIALAVCLLLSRTRVHDWRNSGTLFAQSLRVAPVNNFMAHALLGSFLNDQGRFVDAEPHFIEALKVAPTFPIAQYGMGNSLLAQQQWTNAAEHFSKAIDYSPGYAEAHFGRGTTYLVRGNSEMALADFEEAVRLKPNWAAALNDLAWIRATAADAKYRNGAQAVQLAERACRLAGDRQPLYVGTLAAAYAEAGRFNEAIATGEKARDLALHAGEKSVAERNVHLLELYRANRAYHEDPSSTTNRAGTGPGENK